MKEMKMLTRKAAKVAFGLSLLVMLAGLASCKDDDKDDDGNKGNAALEAKLQGKWTITASRAQGNDTWLDWNSGASTFAFTKTGGYTVTLGNLSQSGTYEVIGKKKVRITANSVVQTLEITNSDQDILEYALYEGTSTTPTAYYKASRMPTTAEEAKRMLIGQWRYLGYEEDGEFIATSYEWYDEFTADGKWYEIKNVPKDDQDESFSKYKGQCVGWLYSEISITPDNADPSRGGLTDPYAKTRYVVYLNYEDLTATSMTISGSYLKDKYTRAPKKIKYKIIDNPYN